MRQAGAEDFADMFVIERIEHLAALAARLHEIRRAEDAQLVAHYRLFEIQLFGNVVHRNLARKHQVDNADTRGIAKELEKLRQLEERVQRDFAGRGDFLRIVVMRLVFDI